MDPTPEPSTALGAGAAAAEEAKPQHCLNHQVSIGVLCKSRFCPLCQAASLQSEQRNFSLQFFHVSGKLPCPEFRLWLFFLAFL